jgi:hypothetical protein
VKSLTQPYGWLSLTALEWLKPGVTTVGSAAGNSLVLAGAPAHLATFEQKNGKVAVIASDSSLLLHGHPLVPGDPRSVIGPGEDDDSALASAISASRTPRRPRSGNFTDSAGIRRTSTFAFRPTGFPTHLRTCCT